ncbi:MAG: ABC transporter permease [Acidobacteriota bacterium]
MHALLTVFRHAARRLAKTPGATAISIFAMAMGIGLTASMFGVIQGLYLRGLPFSDSHEIVHLECANVSKGQEDFEVTQHDFAVIRDEQKSFESIAGFTGGTFNLADGGLPERFDGIWISPGFDELLGVEPVLGRSFRTDDAKPGAEPVLLLSHEVWRQRYGSDPKVVGRSVRLNSEPTTIIGVMPEGFEFPAVNQMWMPLLDQAPRSTRGSKELPTLEVVARLQDGVSLDEAAVEMTLLARRVATEFPETNEGTDFIVQPLLFEFVDEETRQITSVMFVAVVLVLLIACFNVANLLIGRASMRGRELAIRSALGSGRWRQLGAVLAEAGMIAFGGALLGIVYAQVSLNYFSHEIQLISPPFWMEFYLDWTVVAMAILAALVSTLVSGLVPALQASRPDLRSVLSDANRGSTSFRVGWVSRVMVVTQVAISTALLIAAGMAVRSVIQVNLYEHNFDGDRVLSARVGLFEGTYPDEESRLAFFDEIRRRLAENPEVEAAAVGNILPTDGEIGGGGTFYERPGETYEDTFERPWARYGVISPGYFEALSAAVLRGRDFNDQDRAETPRVALVNEKFAAREWPDEDPIGKTIDLWMGDEEEAADAQAGVAQVVGVVANLRFAEFDNADDQHGIYVPLAQSPGRFSWLILKTRSAPGAFSESLRRTVLEVDPDLPLYFVRTMDQVLERTLFFPNLLGILFTLFGVAAVFLACVGLYGLMAFAVTRRTQEMGVRMALGARSEDVLRLVIGQGVRQTLLGLVLGVLLGGGLSMVLASYLFQVEAGDPLIFVIVPMLLLAVAAAACAAPAHRAASTDPLVALRHD